MKFIIEYIYAPFLEGAAPELMEIAAFEARDTDAAEEIALDTCDVVLAHYLRQRRRVLRPAVDLVEYRINPLPVWTKQRGALGQVLQGMADEADTPSTTLVQDESASRTRQVQADLEAMVVTAADLENQDMDEIARSYGYLLEGR